MDGVDDWTCSAWSDCLGGEEVVFCNGNYGHNYPFYDERPRFIAGFRIIWDFMMSHRKDV